MGERDNRTVEVRGSSPLISTITDPLAAYGEGVVVSNRGLWGWLISIGVMELVIVAVTVSVNLYVLRPGH